MMITLANDRVGCIPDEENRGKQGRLAIVHANLRPAGTQPVAAGEFKMPARIQRDSGRSKSIKIEHGF
jgi:hypothetical protein